MRPVKSAERKMKPSAAETKPKGWLTTVLMAVGRCVSVIQTSIRPRTASSSRRRCMSSGRLDTKGRPMVWTTGGKTGVAADSRFMGNANGKPRERDQGEEREGQP